MRKQDMISQFILQLEEDLAVMKAAAKAAHEAATHEESKPENEYDTRGLEMSYLAGAQAERAGQIEEVLYLFRSLEFKDFGVDDPIRATALVELKMGQKKTTILLMPKGGGVQIDYAGKHIQIVTPQSSLGAALLGLQTGDIVEYEVGQAVREGEVLAVM